ncbi:14936_t:CDS:2, partial [Cetraspora pellucida]
MDKYRGETSRQSPDYDDISLAQINDSLASLDEIENDVGYATQDDKVKLESLYRNAIKQASREEEMDKKISKDIEKYLESTKDSRTPS